jgi:hypothetical protein
MSPNKPEHPSTLDRIFSVERRIRLLKGDFEGLFEKYVTDLLQLRELRERLCSEMVDDAFPPSQSDKTPMLAEGAEEEKTFDQIPYDRLILSGKEEGDYGGIDYLYQGQLGTYKLRFGQSITDDGKVFYIYQNNKMFVNLFPTRTKRVFVGKDEEDKEFYIFRFDGGGEVLVYKRRYEF